MRILRHQIGVVDSQILTLPGGGTLLSAAVSRTAPEHAIDVWSLTPQVQGAHTEIEVFVIGTGNPIPDAAQEALLMGKFLGTVVTPAGLVWHVVQGKHR